MGAAGSYDRQIVLQRCTRVPVSGGTGAPVETWSTLATCWARVVHEGAGDEAGDREGRARLAFIRSTFTIRRQAAFTPTAKDRISFGGRTWEVLGVQQPKRLNDYELLARTRPE